MSFVLPSSAGVPPSLGSPCRARAPSVHAGSSGPPSGSPPLAAGMRTAEGAKCAAPCVSGCRVGSLRLPVPRCRSTRPSCDATAWQRRAAAGRQAPGPAAAVGQSTHPLRAPAPLRRDTATRHRGKPTHLCTAARRGRRERRPHGERGREAAGDERERGAMRAPQQARRACRRSKIRAAPRPSVRVRRGCAHARRRRGPHTTWHTGTLPRSREIFEFPFAFFLIIINDLEMYQI